MVWKCSIRYIYTSNFERWLINIFLFETYQCCVANSYSIKLLKTISFVFVTRRIRDRMMLWKFYRILSWQINTNVDESLPYKPGIEWQYDELVYTWFALQQWTQQVQCCWSDRIYDNHHPPPLTELPWYNRKSIMWSACVEWLLILN